jgi:glycosyltransferase involved in cell wall biosynthesis
MKKISIVITHNNRSHLFERTLETIALSKEQSIEVVVVDDCSTDFELKKLQNILDKFDKKFNFKLIELKKCNKWYNNPCIPFNIGIKQATSDIIILQSAECMHMGSVVDFTLQHLSDGEFLSFACYSLNKEQTEYTSNKLISNRNDLKDILNFINPPVNRAVLHCEESGWYNHSIYRPIGFHWCNAYLKSDLLNIKMFDERFAWGIAYDDNEFIHRCKRSLSMKLIDTPLVLHQWHGLGNYYQFSKEENQLKQDYNKQLFEKITCAEKDNEKVVNHLSNTIYE